MLTDRDIIGCEVSTDYTSVGVGQTLKFKPIFYLKTGLRWVPDANEIYTKNMKCTCPTPAFCVGSQRNLYSTGWHRGLASGKTQILALGNAKTYQHVGISNAKFWRRGHCPTPAPDARYFAFWWNIGLRNIITRVDNVFDSVHTCRCNNIYIFPMSMSIYI